MKKTPCILCGIELEDEYVDVRDDAGRVSQKLSEKHAQIWVHNPRNLHEDILVPVHKVCYDKVKASYAEFDIPTEKDWNDPKIPAIDKDGKIAPKNLPDVFFPKTSVPDVPKDEVSK